MARVVRPGGVVASYVWSYDQAASPLDPLEAAFESAGIPAQAPPSVGVTSLAALRDLWAGAGLEGIETRTIAVERIFANFEELWSSATATGRLKSTVASMDADTVAHVQAALRVRLPADREGRITCTALANAIKGRVRA